MIINDNKHFLFMEPLSKNTEDPIDDEITKFVEHLMAKCKENSDYTKGWHTCACKAGSDSNTKTVNFAGRSLKTNSLAVHYVKFHRSEVPTKDLELIMAGINYMQSLKKPQLKAEL